MTAQTLAEQYFAMWNEVDADRRAAQLAELGACLVNDGYGLARGTSCLPAVSSPGTPTPS